MALSAETGGQQDPVLHDQRCPWKGLDAYASEDGALFVGRERAVRQLRDAMHGSTLAGVVGASGSGKSSLLAGLGDFDGVSATVRPGPEPMRVLRETMVRFSALRNLDHCPVVAVDQIEEVFTLCADEAERAAYLDELCDIAESGRARVVVALRSDHYGTCAPYRRFAEALSQSHVLLGVPTEEELRRIITVPASAAGVLLEPGLADEIIDDVIGEPGSLPLLSHALSETWSQRDGDTLTRAAYRRAGGVRGAIARTAEALWTHLPEGRQQAAKTILIRLCAPGAGAPDVSRRVAASELILTGDSDGEAALAALVRARLVTVDSGTAEIAHEAVFREWPRLRGWIEADRDAFRMLAQLRANARLWSEQHDDTMLYRGARLQAVFDVVDSLHSSKSATLPLDEMSKSFFAASVESAKRDEEARVLQVLRERRANRRLRVLLTSALALLAVAVAAGALAVRQGDRAADERRTADARRLAAVAAEVRADRRDLAVLLSREASTRSEDLETRGALFATLTDQPGLQRYLYVNDSIIDVAVDPTGELIAFAGDDQSLEIWDISAAEPVLTRSIPLGGDATPQRIRFLPDRRILTADSGGGIHIVDAETGARVLDAVDHGEDGVPAVALSPNGKVIASGGDDALVRLTDATTGKDVHGPLAGHEDAIQFTEFSPDGRTLLTGGGDGALRLWSTATWEPIGDPLGFDVGLWDVRWMPDQTRFVVASEAGVQFFDATRREPVSPVIAAHDGITYRLELIDDGATLVTSGEDGWIRFWDTASYRPTRNALRGHAAGARMDIADATPRMVSASDDGTIAVWDLRGASAIATPIAERPDGRTQVVTTPDGRIFTADRSGHIREWDVAGQPLGPPVLAGAPVTAMSVSASGARAAIARADGKVQVLELPSGRSVTPLLQVGTRVVGVALSPDGRRLLTSQTDRTCDACFMLYDLSSDASNRPLTGIALRPPALAEGQRSPGNAGAFDATSSRVVTGTHGGLVDVWDATSGAHMWATDVPRGIRAFAFSPDGKLLAVGANSGLLVILDATNGAAVQHLRGHRGEIASVSFAPHGRLLASVGSQDHSLRIWRLDLGLTFGRPAWLGVDGAASLGWTDGGKRVAAPHFLAGAMLFDVDAERLRAAACAMARRNLTVEEWRQYFGDKPYRPTCPSYPPGT